MSGLKKLAFQVEDKEPTEIRQRRKITKFAADNSGDGGLEVRLLLVPLHINFIFLRYFLYCSLMV